MRIRISFRRIGLVRFTGIRIHTLSLSDDSGRYHMTFDEVDLVLSIRRLLKRSPHALQIQFRNGEFSAAGAKGRTGNDAISLKKKRSPGLPQLVRRLYRYSGKLLKLIRRLGCPVIGIDKLKIGLHGKTVIVENLLLKLRVERKATELYSFSTDLTGGLQLGGPAAGSRSSGHPLEMALRGELGRTGIAIGRDSRFRFDKLEFRTFLQHSFDTEDIVEAGLDLEKCGIDQLLRSFPFFQHRELYSTSFTGGFGFSALFKFRLNDPYDRDFQVTVDNDLRMVDPGRLDLHYLKRPFSHLIHRNGTVERTLHLQEESGKFVPLGRVSKLFKDAVICSEDPCFYEHKGIHAFSIGFAIATNIEKKSFARGASTISMQLVKNLFLNHGRNFARKIEEMILTWLMEEVFETGKERILEIYLNIVEFGPDVYGIGEASEFYFGKDPSQLTLSESLVLTYVIPRPRFFLDALKTRSATLQTNLKKHISFYSSEMVKKGYIDEADVEDSPLDALSFLFARSAVIPGSS